MAYTYKLWTPDEETLLKRLCEEGKMNYEQMARAYFPGRTGPSLQGHAKQVLNIKSNYRYRKHFHNERFFEELNPTNCYVAGWLSSDGCIRSIKEGNGEWWSLVWVLHESDKHVLENIKRWMGYTGDIKCYNRKEGRKHVRLAINGITQIRNDLVRHFGIVQRKSHRLPPPNLVKMEHKLAYLAGLLDGDGCIHPTKLNGIITVKIASCAKDLLQWVLDLLLELKLPEIRSPKPLSVKALKQANTYEVAISGVKAVHFIELMRTFAAEHNIPILSRKWDSPLLNEYISAYKTKFPEHFSRHSGRDMAVRLGVASEDLAQVSV